jgi:glycosyltransferase involved in cell wall biosynthesis
MNNQSSQKNDLPFFSVVIPVYNKGPHIHRSVSSVLNQTWQNFELILVNDASTDNSFEEIQKFTDDRIRLFQRTEPGPGGYAARNLGIEKAKGEWVAFLDADDEWYPNHLGKMQALAQEYPDVYFMSCGWETQNKGIKKENAFYKSNKTQKTLKIKLSEYLKFGSAKKLPVCASVACVKKSSPITLNLFPADLGAKRGGDLHAWLKMMCYHKEMAWRSHIEAIYHLDSTNMVTKKAKSSLHLWNSSILLKLSQNLNHKEKILLELYFNKTLIAAIKKIQPGMGILKMYKSFFKNDFFSNISVFISIIYIKIYRFLKYLHR